MTPGYCFFQFVTPSDIAYVISVIKNGKEMWDQEIRLAENQDMGEDKPTKKAECATAVHKWHGQEAFVWSESME